MSTIFYGLCGEGLGHCGRSLALIESLPEHQFVVFTYKHAYKYFQKLKKHNVILVEIKGLEFIEKKGAVDTCKTLIHSANFLNKQLGENKKIIIDFAKKTKPVLLLTDWEPSIPRVAKNLNLPCISIDSQHKFKFYKPEDLNFSLKLYSYAVGLFCNFMVPCADHHVITTFQSELIHLKKNITLSQSLIRRNIADLSSVNQKHYLIYTRQKEIASKLINSILSLDKSLNLICYGVHLNNEYPNVIFKDVGNENFACDLASCQAVFSTAGTQLIGESRYHGKPIFVVPIPNQYEQYVNAKHVNLLKIGFGVLLHQITPEKIKEFLNVFKDGISKSKNGIDDVSKIIKSYLGEKN